MVSYTWGKDEEWAIPEKKQKEGAGGRVEDIPFEPPLSPLEFLWFFSPLETPQNFVITPFGNIKGQSQDPCKFHMIFLDHLWKFHFVFISIFHI